MTFFAKAESTQAYLKSGFMGFAGTGKTYTAAETAIGLVKLLRERKLPEGDRPVFFLDTETGSDYVKRRFDDEGIELFTSKTRAFADLVPAVKEAEQSGAVLIVDSITHFWREFTETYARKKNRTRLEFQDWNFLKTEWGRFTDAYINSALHFILCGRAGYEYNFFEDQDGKKQIEKTGIKMKAESEMGYEPSLLVLMERSMDMETTTVHREAHILKERFGVLDGKTIKNPKFSDFLPHVELLNLGGTQLGVDTTRTSESMIHTEGKPDWQWRKEQIAIMLDEVLEQIKKHHGGRDDSSVKTRGDLMDKHFGSRAWKRIETFDYETIKKGRDSLWMELDGVPYGFVPPSDLDTQQEAGLSKIKP